MATGTRARAIPGVTDPAPLRGGLQTENGTYIVFCGFDSDVYQAGVQSVVVGTVVDQEVDQEVNQLVEKVTPICRSSMASAVTILRASVR